MSDNENKKEKTETAAGKESKRESEEKAEDIKYDGNSHVKADAVIQTLSFTGLELNPVVNNSMSLILLAKSISESQHYVETEISEFRTNFINDILSISAKLSTLNKYDEQDITRFRYCLCVFIDEMVMRNPSFMDSFYSSSSLSIRFFKEPSGGNKFFGMNKIPAPHSYRRLARLPNDLQQIRSAFTFQIDTLLTAGTPYLNDLPV